MTKQQTYNGRLLVMTCLVFAAVVSAGERNGVQVAGSPGPSHGIDLSSPAVAAEWYY